MVLSLQSPEGRTGPRRPQIRPRTRGQDVNRMRNNGLILAVSILLLGFAGIAAADDNLPVPVDFSWAPCPTADAEGRPCAEAVRYEVYLQSGGEDEVLLATVHADTNYTLEAERGVVMRIRVVGYDDAGRASEPSEWSDPIYFDVERTGPEEGSAPPEAAVLGDNYPNPFNPETRIAYGVPEDLGSGARMALEIYNVRGERVRAFDVDQSPGWHEVTWNGLDDRGRPQATGTYVNRYVCGDRVEVGKMTMVK